VTAPEESGPSDAPYSRNDKISNEQRDWLSEQRRCWYCYRPNTACRGDRKDPKKCNSRYSATRLKASEHPGCPKWNH
jgi:hypothetical protein